MRAAKPVGGTMRGPKGGVYRIGKGGKKSYAKKIDEAKHTARIAEHRGLHEKHTALHQKGGKGKRSGEHKELAAEHHAKAEKLQKQLDHARKHELLLTPKDKAEAAVAKAAKVAAKANKGQRGPGGGKAGSPGGKQPPPGQKKSILSRVAGAIGRMFSGSGKGPGVMDTLKSGYGRGKQAGQEVAGTVASATGK